LRSLACHLADSLSLSLHTSLFLPLCPLFIPLSPSLPLSLSPYFSLTLRLSLHFPLSVSLSLSPSASSSLSPSFSRLSPALSLNEIIIAAMPSRDFLHPHARNPQNLRVTFLSNVFLKSRISNILCLRTEITTRSVFSTRAQVCRRLDAAAPPLHRASSEPGGSPRRDHASRS